MNILNDAKLLGLFETAANIEAELEDAEVAAKVGASMPLPATDMLQVTDAVADWLISFKKEKYMFFLPEMKIVDSMVRLNSAINVLFVLTCSMDEDEQNRLRDNVPKKTDVGLIQDPFPVKGMYPSDGLIIVTGYRCGQKMMVLPETYRLINQYSSYFYGKCVFVPYTKSDICYYGWLEAPREAFTDIWEGDEFVEKYEE